MYSSTKTSTLGGQDNLTGREFETGRRNDRSTNEKGERGTLQRRPSKPPATNKVQWLPSKTTYPSLTRRIHLVLTEPESSFAATIFFALVVIAVVFLNVTMMIQTMDHFQFTPNDCRTCGGPVSYLFDDDDSIADPPHDHPCVCPPTPQVWTTQVLNHLIYFLTVEWILRVLTYWADASTLAQGFTYLFEPGTLLDFLATFPYYMELTFSTNGLMSLRLLRLFRVFQLVRLGQYNGIFSSTITVLQQSTIYLKVLLGICLFGASLFGSLMYWIEKGEWAYYEPTQSYEFVREDQYGQLRISPFTSIPATFWWFLVTATTVGYGDTYPVTTPGKYVAMGAMLMGILVIAFPVSVFQDLWQKELRKALAKEDLEGDDDDESGVPSKSQIILTANDDARSLGSWHSHEGEESWLLDHQQSSDPQDMHAIVTMSREDFMEVQSELHSIRESQRAIQRVLRRYYRKHPNPNAI